MNLKNNLFTLPIGFLDEAGQAGLDDGDGSKSLSEVSGVNVTVGSGKGLSTGVVAVAGGGSGNAPDFVDPVVVNAKLDVIGHSESEATKTRSQMSVDVGFSAPGEIAKLPPTETEQAIGRLLIAVKTDVGAFYELDAIRVLADINRSGKAKYFRIRDRIKKANSKVSLSVIDKQVNELLKADDDKPTPSTHHILSELLIVDLTVDGNKPVGAEGVFNVLDGSSKVWFATKPEAMEVHVARLHDGDSVCQRRNDYRDIALHALNMISDTQFFTSAPIGVACPGGFYQVQGGEIVVQPLTALHRQRVMLTFTPELKETPMFLNFLHETFKSENDDEEQQQISRLQEIFGATMFGLMPRYHKAVLFYDPYGRAGKGTVCEILAALVPSDFVTNVSPFKWGQEYYLANLAGSRLNLVGELPENTPLPAAEFKTVTGGDILTGRHPMGRPYVFKNAAAHIFSSNHFPKTRDHSDAFFIRWLVVEFPNSRLRSGLALDVGLAQRIIESELPGIAYWAMQGGLRVLQNGKFSESIVADRLIAKWRNSTNSLDEYLAECCDVGDPSYSVKRSELYRMYVEWCSDSGRKPHSKAHVKDLLEHNIKHNITMGSKDGYERFRGVRIKPVPGADLDEDEDLY